MSCVAFKEGDDTIFDIYGSEYIHKGIIPIYRCSFAGGSICSLSYNI